MIIHSLPEDMVVWKAKNHHGEVGCGWKAYGRADVEHWSKTVEEAIAEFSRARNAETALIVRTALSNIDYSLCKVIKESEKMSPVGFMEAEWCADLARIRLWIETSGVQMHKGIVDLFAKLDAKEWSK